MKIERMEVVGIDVKDVDKAMTFFSDLLGIKFLDFRMGKDVKGENGPSDAKDPAALDFNSTRIAIDPTGYLALLQTTPAAAREGFRNMHFKVTDLEEAKAELKAKGIRMVTASVVGGMKEAIFHPDDLHGVRLCLVEYDAPSLIEAVLQKPAH